MESTTEDFSPDGSFAIFTCEFSHSLIKIDPPERPVIGGLTLPARGMPQDIRIAPDGSAFYVVDMMADGVHLLNGEIMALEGFIPTGIGAHGYLPLPAMGASFMSPTAATLGNAWPSRRTGQHKRD